MARKGRATLSDIARIAGLDTSTVSRVLNSEAGQRVSQATRERVHAVARGLGYQPNPMARALRTARTFTLGIAVPQLDNPVFARLIIGAEMAARERGYSVIISHVEEGDSGSTAYARMAQSYRVDGLLAATLEDTDDLIRSLALTELPFVALNRKLDEEGNFTVFDSFAAARLATEHLISLGHRRIAHVAGRLHGYNGQLRLAGYRAALAAAGIAHLPELVEPAGYTFEGGELAMRKLFHISPRPTGIVAATMLAAAGAMKYLNAAGVKIPSEMSIVAVHDAVIADMLHPPLTTVRLPVQQLGAQAAHGLIDLIENKTSRVAVTLAPEGLIERESTGKPPVSRRVRGSAAAH